MKYIIKQGKNQLYYYKEYKSGKLVRISKEIFDKYHENKYPNKLNKQNKKIYSGGSINSTGVPRDSYDPQTSYVVVGYEDADTDNPVEIKIGIYPVFSIAKEALISWCQTICKNQSLKNGEVGIHLNKDIHGLDGYVPLDRCEVFENGRYYVRPNSRMGKIYYMNNKNNIIERNRQIFEYPSNTYLENVLGIDI